MKSVYLIIILFLVACSDRDYTPKPAGYFRIDLDRPVYRTATDPAGMYSFHIQEAALIEQVPETNGKGEWFNIIYPHLDARIYCSLLPVNTPEDLHVIGEATRELLTMQMKKAEDIDEKEYSDPSNRVYARLFEIRGNTASPVQFLITDSLHYFLRGSLYFNATPNQDSIAPVRSYIKEDIMELISSFNRNRHE